MNRNFMRGQRTPNDDTPVASFIKNKADSRQAMYKGAVVDLQSLCLCRADKVCGWCFFRGRIAESFSESLRRQMAAARLDGI